MNNRKIVTQVAPSIWKVVRFNEKAEEKESVFVKELNGEFTTLANVSCVEDEKGLLHFLLDGKDILSEKETEYTIAFNIGEDDGIFGLGIHQHKPFNRRGQVCQMAQVNGSVTAVPFLTSDKGYAILFDTCAYMSIGIDKPCTKEHLTEYSPKETAPNSIQVFADDADVFTYYVILGSTIDEQIAGYRALTGKSTMFPKWLFGFMQSREHYRTQEELLEIAREFRKRHIPLDCIVQDWNYWGKLGWNAIEWDEGNYPDPKGMLDEVHNMDIKLMISVWPSFGPETTICKEIEGVGGILEKPDKSGERFGRVHDPLNKKASDIIWKYMEQNLLSIGVDAWWLDSTEPAFEKDCSLCLLECNSSSKGDNHRYLNHYALCTSRNVYENQRSITEDKRVFILTRSGYAGQQACGASTWTGDIRANWAVFKEQLSSLLGFSASGNPFSTTDIGAFFVDYKDGNQNKDYRELYTRWFWFGAFCPIFRSHGTSTPREMWFFGEPGTEYFDAQMAATKLRYTLMPYIYANAFKAYDEDYTIMRPLVMDFPKDKNAKDIFDSYMFGDSLLVHIVTEPDLREEKVYLPDGCEWINFFTDERYMGGRTVTVAAPINQTPLFVKAGSIVVTTEPAECTAWQDEKELEINVYSGANAATFYYLDDGDNYSYEQGNYVKIPFLWQQDTNRLVIGDVKGQKDNFDINKTLKIYIDGKLQKTVSYKGEKIELCF